MNALSHGCVYCNLITIFIGVDQWFSNVFTMEPFDIVGNITVPLFKLILSTRTIKEMFYLTKLMS